MLMFTIAFSCAVPATSAICIGGTIVTALKLYEPNDPVSGLETEVDGGEVSAALVIPAAAVTATLLTPRANPFSGDSTKLTVEKIVRLSDENIANGVIESHWPSITLNALASIVDVGNAMGPSKVIKRTSDARY